MSAAREQVLNTSAGQLNDTSTSLMSMEDDEEQMALPKPNYDAEKPEDVFVFDDSLCFLLESFNDLLVLFYVHSYQ